MMKQTRVPFQYKESLVPTEVYGSIIGALEKETIEDNKKRFKIVDTVEGEIHHQVPEYARIYFDTVENRHIIVHLPGQDGKRSRKQPEATLIEIKQKVDDQIFKAQIELTNALYFYPIAKYPGGHFIAAWIENEQIYVEDSFPQAKYFFSKEAEKQRITNITDTLNPKKDKTVNSINYQGWQYTDWECGYFTGDVAKRLIITEQNEKEEVKKEINKKDEGPNIDEKYVLNAKNNFDINYWPTVNKPKKSITTSTTIVHVSLDDFNMGDHDVNKNDEFTVIGENTSTSNNEFERDDDDNYDSKKSSNKATNPYTSQTTEPSSKTDKNGTSATSLIEEIDDREFESEEEEEKKDKKEVEIGTVKKDTIIAMIEAQAKKYDKNSWASFFVDRKIRAAQLRTLNVEIKKAESFKTAVETWKEQAIVQSKSNKNIKLNNADFMAKHNNFFRATYNYRGKPPNTAIQDFIATLETRCADKKFS